MARAEVGEHELEVAPQRLRVGVARLAPARASACCRAGGGRSRAWSAAAPTRGAGGAARAALGSSCGVAAPATPVSSSRDRDPQRGVREHPRQPVHAGAEAAAARCVRCSASARRERVGADLGVAVHVAAGPAAVGQHRLHEPDAERVLDLAQHGRDRVEQHGLEEEQVAADLVLDARADRGAARRSATTASAPRAARPAARAGASGRCAGRRAGPAARRRPTGGRARERRVASVGCAVSTCSICSWAASGAMSMSLRAQDLAPSRPATRAGSRRSRRTGAGGARARAPRRCSPAAARASRRG